jgi:polysaccharide deacetylase family protein (PEP-CTERM system associated)
VDPLLKILQETGNQATFFVLGDLAERAPEVIREIAAAGHEIACHGMRHRPLHELDRTSFRADIRQAKALLEDLTGQEVVGYRAPWWSITSKSLHLLEVIAEEGFSYDSSIFPAPYNGFYGIGGACLQPHRIRFPSGQELLEIPPAVMNWHGLRIPYGGGIYWRLMPKRFVLSQLKSQTVLGARSVLYIHPWELDRDQPVIDVGLTDSLIHYTNMRAAGSMLRSVVAAHTVGTIRDCILAEPPPALQRSFRSDPGGAALVEERIDAPHQKLSVIIPVYTEPNSLVEVLDRVLDVQIPLEKEVVVVVDARLSDSTRKILAHRQSSGGTSVVQVSQVGVGKGTAIQMGLTAATGDLVLLQDADLELDPAEYPKLLQPVLAGEADVVYGTRDFWNAQGSQRTTKLANLFLSNLTSVLFQAHIADMETACKLFRRPVLDRIRLGSDDFDFEPEITAKVLRLQYRLAQVPITYTPNAKYGGPKPGWKDGLRAATALVRFRLAPRSAWVKDSDAAPRRWSEE